MLRNPIGPLKRRIPSNLWDRGRLECSRLLTGHNEGSTPFGPT